MLKIVKSFMVTLFLIISTFVFTGVISVPTLATESYITPPGVTLLTADEIRETLIGNTVIGESEGFKYYEYMKNDRRLFGKWRSIHYSANWSISESDSGFGIVCFDYDGSDFDGCWTIAKNENGDALTYYNSDGSVDLTENLLPENPGNL